MRPEKVPPASCWRLPWSSRRDAHAPIQKKKTEPPGPVSDSDKETGFHHVVRGADETAFADVTEGCVERAVLAEGEITFHRVHDAFDDEGGVGQMFSKIGQLGEMEWPQKMLATHWKAAEKLIVNPMEKPFPIHNSPGQVGRDVGTFLPRHEIDPATRTPTVAPASMRQGFHCGLLRTRQPRRLA